MTDHDRSEAAYMAAVEDQAVDAYDARFAPVVEQAAKVMCNYDLADERAWDAEDEGRRDLWRAKARRLRDGRLLADPDVALAVRVAVAAELRRLADEGMASFETYRACCSIPISHCRLCSTREHAACRAALDLRTRADALDPEGATR